MGQISVKTYAPNGSLLNDNQHTGCENPQQGRYLDGGPNNLGGDAAALFEAMRAAGCSEEDFLLYVASFYNSPIANEFLEAGGGKALHIPLSDVGRAVAIVPLARRLRNIVFATKAFADQIELNAREVPYNLDDLAAEGLFEVRQSGGGRFVPTQLYSRNDQTLDRFARVRETTEEELDALVRAAYGFG